VELATVGRRPGPVRVVIVEDHALVRAGTLQLLETVSDMLIVGQAGSGEEGLVLIDQARPDVAVVDVNLPGMTGLDLAAELRRRCPSVAVLIVSAYDDAAYLSEALDVGVSGYLLKTATATEFLDAVRAVADGVFVLDRALSGRLRRQRGQTTGVEGLTQRETDVLRLLVLGRSNKQIARELGLGLRTIETHVSNLLAKLGVLSRTEAVAYALRKGLVPAGYGDPSLP
jgi:DNA-binding NarL/FixJ family response regulator